MKLQTNNLSGPAMLLKHALASHLSETGSSIAELEASLAASPAEKTAAVLKVSGASLLASLQAILGMGGSAAMMGAGSAALTGALAGGAGYVAYKGIRDSGKKVQDADAIRMRLDLARQQLQQAAPTEGV